MPSIFKRQKDRKRAPMFTGKAGGSAAARGSPMRYPSYGGPRFSIRIIAAIIAGIVGIGGAAYFVTNSNMFSFSGIFQTVTPDKEAEEAYDYAQEESTPADIPVEEQPGAQVFEPEPSSSVTNISVINSDTNESLRGVWVYKDSDGTKCITGIEETLCVTAEPDCITDDGGLCYLEMEPGEHSLLFKIIKDGATIFSHKTNISVPVEGSRITIPVSMLRPVAFEVTTEDLAFVDGAEVFADGKSLGSTDNGILSSYLGAGSHDVVVRHTNQFGRDVAKKTVIDVVEQSENKFVIQLQAFTYEELRDYALSLINDDRKKIGLEQLSLIDNEAAQKHAEEMVSEGYMSNWNTEGLKPYTRYTLFGGGHAMAENIALAYCGSAGDSAGQKCASDPAETIKKLHSSVMLRNTETNYNKDNVLSKWHNGVSIGVAYSSDYVALVYDFEARYTSWVEPIRVTSGDAVLQMSGVVMPYGFKPTAVAIYRDKLPQKLTPDVLSEFPYDGGYDRGALVSTIDKASVLRGTSANKWISDDSGRFEISFSLPAAIFSSEIYSNEGVYTLYLLARNTAGEHLTLTSYSVKYEEGVLSTLDGSELWKCNLVPKHKC